MKPGAGAGPGAETGSAAGTDPGTDAGSGGHPAAGSGGSGAGPDQARDSGGASDGPHPTGAGGGGGEPPAWISLEAIEAAAERLRGVVRETPLLETAGLPLPLAAPGAAPGATPVWLKAESLQLTGSFKLRGAYNRLCELDEPSRRAGVVAASAGNHAQGVALAAGRLGIAATVVMPEGASIPKVAATRALGAEVVLAGRSFDEAQKHARRLAAQRGLTFVPAFDDPRVVAGQGTVGLEIVERLPDVDLVVVPVGGGGLAAGVACAVRSRRPRARVVGVQAAGCPSVVRALQAGRPVRLKRVHTIADGIAVGETSPAVLGALRRWLDGVVLVEEAEIAWAMVVLAERAHLVVEGAGAVGVAALLSGRLAPSARTAVVVSGGNVDPAVLAEVVERGLVGEGRHIRLVTRLPDRPGELGALLAVVAREGANILAVEHDRLRAGVRLGEAEVALSLETRDHDHAQAVAAALRAAGYPARDGAAEAGDGRGAG